MDIPSTSRSLASDCLKIVVDFPLFDNPTVPFLLGAMKLAGHVECSSDGLRELLETMRDRIESATNLVIENCSTIGQIVVKAQPHLTAEIWFESEVSHSRRLFCERIAGHDIRCNDLESLTHALWQIHGADIASGDFSYHPYPRRWTPFDTEETHAIESVLGLGSA